MPVLPVEGQVYLPIHGKDGVSDFAQKGGEVAEVFGEFCRDSLCMESWDFIMDCMAYKEINLGSKMQDQLRPFQTM
eukprot:jgi/Undpi1/10026/HiC_scaffold_28.g12480.m1